MDFPALLPQGLHPKTWAEIEAMCVTGIPLSTSRPTLLAGLRALVDRLVAEGVVGDLWIDGSFVTQKLEPADVDIVLHLSPATFTGGTPTMQDFLRWIGSSDLAVRAQVKAQYHCDSYLCFDVPPVPRDYWERQFGRDRDGNLKGIAVLPIPGGVQ